MNSSPERGAVEAFKYHEPGAFDVKAGGAAAAGRAIASEQPRDTSDDLDLKIAAARAEGIREGLLQAQSSVEQELTRERAKVAEALRLFAQKTGEYYSRAEIELVHLSLAIAAKILHREAQVDRMLVAALVKVALEKIQHGTTATVRVPPEEVGDWHRYFEGDPGGEIRVEVKADPAVEARNCVLETELGTTELGLNAQLKEVEQGFFDLLAQRPDTK